MDRRTAKKYCRHSFNAVAIIGIAMAANGENRHLELRQLEEIRPSLRYHRPFYRNFAHRHFENYGEQFWPVRTSGSQQGIADGPSRPREHWSKLGDYQVTGYDLFSWIERRQPDQRFGSALFKDWGAWQPLFTNVVVARDGYRDWGYSAIVGDGLISRFSPLTLSKTDLNGLRFDLVLSPVQFTGIGSRISKPNRETYQPSADIFEVDQRHVTMLLGSSARAHLGGVTLGLNGANLHAYTSTRPGNGFKGSLRQDQPLYEFIVVRVSDDAPADGVTGAVVQSMQLIVNGEPRPDLTPTVISHLADTKSHVGRKLGGAFIPVSYTGFLPPAQRRIRYSIYYQRDLPLYADYLYRVAHERGADVSARARAEGLVRDFRLLPSAESHRADGQEHLIFLFDLQDERLLESVEVEAIIGNDYRVEWSGIFARERQTNTMEFENRYQSMYYQTVARARDRVSDLSNLRRLRFPIGENTGIVTYSGTVGLQFPGLEVSAEYARSAVYGRYPASLDGSPLSKPRTHFANRGSAYFVNGTRWFQGGRVGAELFSMNSGFTTEMLAYSPDDTGRLRGGGQDPFEGLVNDSVIWRLVQDNEDGDRWPDIVPGNVLGSPQNQSGADLDGVFPGQDDDFDGVPDTDRNFNGKPDYEEPFLLYYVDPNEYVYGLDRNNNDEPDQREDDWDADHPYELGQRGYHFFVQMDLGENSSVAAGRYRSRNIASGGRSQSVYGLFNYRRTGRGVIQDLFFENQTQKLEDDIPDIYTIFEDSRIGEVDDNTQIFTGIIQKQEGRLISREDLLFYQDSITNESYLEGRAQPWPGLRIEQKLRLRMNWQQGGRLGNGLSQRRRRLDFLTSVSRVGYSLAWGRFEMAPRCKLLFLRLRDQTFEQDLRWEYQVVPLLKLSYPIMDRTTLRLGLQGWGRLPYRLKNWTQRRESFEDRTTTVTVTNVSTYYGYDLRTIVGVIRNRREYDDPFRKSDEVNLVHVFVRALVGFTEFGRLL